MSKATEPDSELPVQLMADAAARHIAERLGILIGQARALLQFEGLPPGVMWQGDVPGQYVNHDPNLPAGKSRSSGLVWRPEELNRAWFKGAEIDWHECTMRSPQIRGLIGRLMVDTAHLEAWLQKRAAATHQAKHSKQLKLRPGPKTPAARDREISRRLKAGDRPAGLSKWAHEIRSACKVEESALGYSDDRIGRMTRDLLRELLAG